MALTGIKFKWLKPKTASYLLCDGRINEVRTIGKRIQPMIMTDGTEYWLTPYDPLNDVIDLYRQFSVLGSSESDILAFANQYGLLGIPRSASIENIDKHIQVELLTDWHTEISNLAGLLDLWDCLEFDKNRSHQLGDLDTHNASESDLDIRITWDSGLNKEGKTESAVLHHWHKPKGTTWCGDIMFLHSARSNHEDLLNNIPVGDKRLAAWVRIETTVNAQLQKYSSMGFSCGAIDYSKNQYTLDKPNLSIHPKNLLGAMWLQFAYEVMRYRLYRPCIVCSKAIVEEIKQGKDKITCSNACRQKLARERKKLKKNAK